MDQSPTGTTTDSPVITVIVPTYNERDNAAELVGRLATALQGQQAEILFVDDSTDDTPDVVRRIAESAPLPVRMHHRERGTGGLSGAVVEGFRRARGRLCIVIDGDLQHPPELIPRMLDRYARGDVDVVAASRYVGEGDAHGLGTSLRFAVSRVSTAITKAMFPLRLSRSTDPMTGFFLVDRDRFDVDALRPSGFKILLEILVRSEIRMAEVPMDFAERQRGSSKASMRQGATFLAHLARLRFGKMSVFAFIGALGAVANLGIMWLLIQWGVPYIWAAIVGAEVTIIGNFLLQERFVFHDLRAQAAGGWIRFLRSFTFNNAEAAIRIPVLALLVEVWGLHSVFAAALTLAVAFIARFVYHSLFVYAPRKKQAPRTEPVKIVTQAQMVQTPRSAES
ncbi:glycosyltransferase [Microbacterium sp. YY-01]|uniref:glycosyltransferase n=1 Tax=Microbacterium sp. YY-01 TaxID=3421634 RepID=UPI003D181031